MVKRSFFFHYNKPASQKVKKPQVTIHYNKTCYIVDNIECNVKTHGRIRNVQPKFVMCGKCEKFEIVDGVGVLS